MLADNIVKSLTAILNVLANGHKLFYWFIIWPEDKGKNETPWHFFLHLV